MMSEHTFNNRLFRSVTAGGLDSGFFKKSEVQASFQCICAFSAQSAITVQNSSGTNLCLPASLVY